MVVYYGIIMDIMSNYWIIMGRLWEIMNGQWIFWVNYNDLTVLPHNKIIFSKGNHPKMTEPFVLIQGSEI